MAGTRVRCRSTVRRPSPRSPGRRESGAARSTTATAGPAIAWPWLTVAIDFSERDARSVRDETVALELLDGSTRAPVPGRKIFPAEASETLDVDGDGVHERIVLRYSLGEVSRWGGS